MSSEPPFSRISLVFFRIFSPFYSMCNIISKQWLTSGRRYQIYFFLVLVHLSFANRDFFSRSIRLSVWFCNNEEQSNFSVFATGYCWVPPEGCNNILTGEGKGNSHTFTDICNWSTWIYAIGSVPKSIF